MNPDWAITIVDVSTSPAIDYTEVVPDGSADTLIPIIKRVVRQKTVIQTDEWKGYSSLSKINYYTHDKICHKNNFVDSFNGVHTQNVESYNNKIKSDIKAQKGVKHTQRHRFLKLFMFIDIY
ncbi:hypothetical protein DMUE_2461 [Dictyocoela muelleri]|nr:hypothetical protein DMUE_2461 [Dictyocoela muelleri]